MSVAVHRLANGLTVACETMPGIETLAVGLYADVGARAEEARLNGTAHLMEHMVFKGAGPRNARAIAEAIEDVGGNLNAWTARDHTVFHARLLPDDLALGIDLIADLVREPWLDADELEREKQVVLSELGEARDTPDDIVFDHLSAAAWPDQPFGRAVLGDETSIAAIDVAALRDWTRIRYRPANLVLAAAGKVDVDQLLRLAEARFGDMTPGEAPPPPPARFVAGGVHHDVRKFDQLHLALAWEGLPHGHADVHALGLFAGAAGGGMSSRLFQELREARGLAYSVYAWSAAYGDTGQLGLYCAAARRDGAPALKLAREVMLRTAETIDQAELDRARAQARAGLLMGRESVQARCDHLARSLQIHGRVVGMAESLADLAAVQVDQVRRVAATALAGGEVLATVGGKLAKAA